MLLSLGNHAVNRSELQSLAEQRILEAQVLFNAGHWSGAYYLIGYAVELGLKSCVLAYVEKTGVIFQEKKFSESCWTHNLEKLMELAGLDGERAIDTSKQPALGVSWQIVKDWNETARYLSWSEAQARKMLVAVTDPTDGVLPWIKGRW